jgi:hypothetical protein
MIWGRTEWKLEKLIRHTLPQDRERWCCGILAVWVEKQVTCESCQLESLGLDNCLDLGEDITAEKGT